MRRRTFAREEDLGQVAAPLLAVPHGYFFDAGGSWGGHEVNLWKVRSPIGLETAVVLTPVVAGKG